MPYASHWAHYMRLGLSSQAQAHPTRREYEQLKEFELWQWLKLTRGAWIGCLLKISCDGWMLLVSTLIALSRWFSTRKTHGSDSWFSHERLFHVHLMWYYLSSDSGSSIDHKCIRIAPKSSRYLGVHSSIQYIIVGGGMNLQGVDSEVWFQGISLQSPTLGWPEGPRWESRAGRRLKRT